MRAWLLLLAGLLIWTAHFFGIYIAASLFPGTQLAKWLTGILTLLALGLLAVVVLPVLRRAGPSREEALSSWLDGLAVLGAALAALAILYQGLPALAVR